MANNSRAGRSQAVADSANRTGNHADQLMEQPRGAQWTWRVIALVEMLLAAAAVVFDVFIPTIVILLLATISLAMRRAGPSSLGFRRPQQPARMIAAVFVLTVVWNLVVLGLSMPILNHLTGQRQDLSQFENLQGNLPMLLIFLGLSWTLAALGEETAYRGYLPTRISEVVGQNHAGGLLAVGISAALFGLAHTEQGVVGVVLTFLDALFFSALKWRFRTLWAAVLAHGFNNTMGLVTFYLIGPIYGLW
jgi:uncharacterized protein